MDTEVRRLRAAAQRLAQGKPPSQVRYPETFRRAAVRVARRHVGPGASVTRLARALGVSEPTLTKWLRTPPVPALRPVTVTPPPATGEDVARPPVLITPSGVRVEGLDRASLVAVLQALR
jgi:hypothetical protein